ncbi:hypothetical protein T439DRAFT_321591 [Meredithblackwellia eburnea MCA 4105]
MSSSVDRPSPASVLLQPSRTTTATTSSPPPSTSFRFLASSTPASPAQTPPLSDQPTSSLLNPQHQQQEHQQYSNHKSKGPLTTLLPLFSKYPVNRKNRGTVRIRVEDTTFYCHREVLVLASPFFESCIDGEWRESAPRPKGSKRAARKVVDVEATSLLHDREPMAREEDDGNNHNNNDNDHQDETKRLSFHTAKSEVEPVEQLSNSETSVDEEDTALSTTPTPSVGPALPRATASEKEEEVVEVEHSPVPLSPPSPPSEAGGSIAPSFLSSVLDDYSDSSSEEDEDEDDEAVICRLRLVDEKAEYFQDLLCHIYPRLECLISWNNAGELCRMASKFDVPSLRNACIAFLLPSAAGKPLAGMKIAEEMNIPELYKEASRYTLDNYQNWPPEELAALSPPTLLKLERRRSWFLERLLKLGIIQISRDYVCQPTCPDPTLCAKLVDEKWRSAWSSSFRFGTPQPSIIYRSLRNLEPSLSSPALHLPHTACQSHARLYVGDLFDRMFNLGITAARSWGALTLNGTSGAGGYGRTFGPSQDGIAKNSVRYFLYVEMNERETTSGGGKGNSGRGQTGGV